ASFLPAGTLSVYNYVQQLAAKFYTIIMGPVSTVFFTQITNVIVGGAKKLDPYLKKPTLYIYIIFYSIFIIIAMFGQELLSLLWSVKSVSADHFNFAFIMLVLNFAAFIFTSVGYLFRKVGVAL